MMKKRENEYRMSKGSEMTRHVRIHTCVYTRKSHNGSHGEVVALAMKETLQFFSLVDAEVASFSSSYSTSSRAGKGAGP